MSISSFFSDISDFLSGVSLDEDGQNVVDTIQESNETNLTGQGATLPTPQESLEELDDNVTDEDNDTILPEEYIPILNPQDNIGTNNPADTSCDKKIVDAYFAHKGEKAVASSEVGSYTFNNPYVLLEDNTTNRQKVIDDILQYIVKNRLGSKYANDTTKGNIDTALEEKKLGRNVPITFDIYNSETQETTSHSAIIKNSSGTYDGRKSIPTPKREGVVKYIVTNLTVPNDGKKYITTKKDVEEALSKKSYAKNDVVENIKLYVMVNDYTKITKANLASKVYLVAETKNFRNGTSVKFKIFENGDKLLSDYVNDKEELPFLLGTNEKTEVMGQVVTADVDDPETGNALEGRVAIEVALRPKKDKPDNDTDSSANLEDWKKKFKKAEGETEDKEDKFYLKVSTTDYPNIEEQSFLVGDELVVKSAGCKMIKVQCTRSGKRVRADGSIYYLNYGPVIWGSQPLKDYSNWAELITNNKITEEEKKILIGMSVTEGKLDSLNCYDSEAITMGAMQKTVNPSGKGQLAKQFQDFKEKYPDKFEEILGTCGWSVVNNQVFYTQPRNGIKITGKKLKMLLRKGYNSSNVFNQVESEHLGALVKLSKDNDFLDLQVLDFIEYYRRIMGKTIYGYNVNQYIKSKLGRAVVLDQYVNRPGYTITDLKKALDRFLNKNPSVNKNPTLWGVNHSLYEATIIKDYGKKRRGTDMKGRYDKLEKAFK